MSSHTHDTPIAEPWRLVRLVQETLTADGELLLVGMDGSRLTPLANLRRLADDINPAGAEEPIE